MKPVLIICLGNPLMRDEGIGIRLATELTDHLADNPDVEVMDLGTGGFSVIHAIEGWEKIVFVDCAIMGKPPGLIRRFTPEQVSSKKVRMRYSMHEGDLLNTIDLSRRLGQCPDDIVIFGIEPMEISDGQGLTSELENNIQHYVQTILEELDIT
ncbi:MAG: hydrogenase maturation protease [Planctomycetes bacterium]|nr:hydrogenase maturation protease [Planctomycetota bacterium]